MAQQEQNKQAGCSIYLKAELGIVISRQCLLQQILKQPPASCFMLGTPKLVILF